MRVLTAWPAVGWLLIFGCGGTPPAAPVWGFCEANLQDFPRRPGIGEPATLPWLRVEGTDIVDEEGRRVALRGYNFGSWLMMESWMAGIGLLDEEGLIEEAARKAEALGIGPLFEAARSSTALEWLLEVRSHRVLVEAWRSYMEDHAGAGEQDAVAAFWAWFDGQPWIFEEQSLWGWLEKRFGYSRAQELRRLFQDHYITELDVQRLSELGLNTVRLPVWFELLETDFAGDVHFRPEGWQRLHQFLLWARRHRLYVILDLHGAPGGQSASWHQGLTDGGHLFENQACLDKTARLWQALARYLANDPHLAAYDLLNEPMSSPSAEDYRRVHDRLYRAIRTEDSRHMIIAEDGYKPSAQLVSPLHMGWENALFSIHLYPGGDSAERYLELVDRALVGSAAAEDRFSLPLLLGEFNAADGQGAESWAIEGMRLVLDRLNRRGVHWTVWSWKYYDDRRPWGLYAPREPGQRIDVQDASFEDIAAAFRAQHSSNFAAHAQLQQVLKQAAVAPPAPRDLSGKSWSP